MESFLIEGQEFAIPPHYRSVTIGAHPEQHYHDYVGADSHSFSQVSAFPQLSSLSELCYPRRAPQSGQSSRAASKGVSVVSHEIVRTSREDGASKT